MSELSSSDPVLSAEPIVVQFCGQTCWQKTADADGSVRPCGVTTLRQLVTEGGAAPSDPEQRIHLLVLDGRTVTVQKMQICLGACGKDPSARVGRRSNILGMHHFTADSVQAVRNAIATFEQADGAGKTHE